MTLQRKSVAIGLAVALVLAFSAAVSFGHGMRSRDDDPGSFGPTPEKALERLGVTGEQKTQIQGVLGKYRPEAEPAVKQIVAERRALRRMIQEGASDEGAIRGQAAKVAALESDLAVMRARLSKEVRSLLTEEQKTKLAEYQAKREKKVDRFLERRFREREGEKP